MSACAVPTIFLLLLPPLLAMAMATTTTSSKQELYPIQMSRAGISQAMNWVQAYTSLHGSNHVCNYSLVGVALSDCGKLYGASDARLAQLISGERWRGDEDTRTLLSGALASHETCLGGMEEMGFVEAQFGDQNLTLLLKEALALHGKSMGVRKGVSMRLPQYNQNGGLLTSWNASTSKADFVVAKDGSGTHTTINAALAALSKMGHNRPERAIIYVKSGIYNEKVEIERGMKNVMFVGDGIDKTIVTGNRNRPDGSTTYSSATFGVAGDGFWARGMTFENTAGPEKHQAVALRVNSDLSVFYQCSIKGYQDTLFVHSLRQFYRDCHIYGTVDFIFGDASVVLQNCDIYIKRPMRHQANIITAQGRDTPHENTGISIHSSRVLPSPEFSAVKGMFRTYLGRPWKKYSRTVFIKTDLNGLIAPEGWKEWKGNFALSTLFYGEYMNSGLGAFTDKRVRWPGFHVLKDPRDVRPFTVSSLIQGESWIPATGVPFSPGI